MGGFSNFAIVAATVTAMALIMVPQVLINIFGIRLTARLNDFSVFWHIGGVLIIAALLLALGQHGRPLAFLSETVTTVSPASLAGSFSAGPWTFDSLMMHLPGMQALSFMALYWMFVARHRFRGPRRHVEDAP